ncbi:MAG: hypothetical protein KH452_03760 [Clostridiales bacterium]|nr:hypothetical protein [Clostridiales bacterium]
MEIYFGNNFWGGRDDGEPGEEIRIEKTFEWEGRECRIPAVYACEKGIVTDLCIRIPAEEIRVFLEKWNLAENEGKLSDEELEKIDQENPFSLDFEMQVYINGQEAGHGSMCSTAWNPCAGAQEASVGVEEELMDAYECARDAGWRLVRGSFSYPEGIQAPIHSLRIVLKRRPRTCRGVHFRTGTGQDRKVEFVHPGTGTKHVLAVQGWKQEELPAETMSRMHTERIRFVKSPGHFLMMEYTLEPEIPGDEFQIYDCARSDPPVLEQRRGAASVSVIGGADGPTAVFLAGKGGKPETRSACSSLHYEPVDQVEWRMSFQIRQDHRAEIQVI